MARDDELSLVSDLHEHRGLVSASLAANYRAHDFRIESFHDLRPDHRRDPDGEDGDRYGQTRGRANDAEPILRLG